MTKKQAIERARRGAAFLDEKLGAGWRRKIKRRKLDMSSGVFNGPFGDCDCGCVLAQLDDEGFYGDKAHDLGLKWSGRKVTSLGFFAKYSDEYPALTEAWRQRVGAKAFALAA